MQGERYINSYAIPMYDLPPAYIQIDMEPDLQSELSNTNIVGIEGHIISETSNITNNDPPPPYTSDDITINLPTYSHNTNYAGSYPGFITQIHNQSNAFTLDYESNCLTVLNSESSIYPENAQSHVLTRSHVADSPNTDYRSPYRPIEASISQIQSFFVLNNNEDELQYNSDTIYNCLNSLLPPYFIIDQNLDQRPILHPLGNFRPQRNDYNMEISLHIQEFLSKNLDIFLTFLTFTLTIVSYTLNHNSSFTKELYIFAVCFYCFTLLNLLYLFFLSIFKWQNLSIYCKFSYRNLLITFMMFLSSVLLFNSRLSSSKYN